MHIKTNIELSTTNIAVLAICPMMLAVSYAGQALNVIFVMFFSFFISALICYLFNKVLTKITKVFITAMISTLIVTIVGFFSAVTGKEIGIQGEYIVFATIILSVNSIYFDTIASSEKFIVSLLKTFFIFSICFLIFATFKEMFAHGSFFDAKVGGYEGSEFFETITFSLIFLATICVICEAITRFIYKKIDAKKLKLNKFVERLRGEKKYQYDRLRREKLLKNGIEVINVDDNEEIDTLEKNSPIDQYVTVEERDSKGKTKKVKRKSSRLKVSKEAKVEQAIKNQNEKEGDI